MAKKVENKLRLLLVTPYHRNKVNLYKGGIATWSNLFVEEANKRKIDFRIVDISMKGKRLKNRSAKASVFAEFFRTMRILTSSIINSLFFKPTVVHINSSGTRRGLLRDYYVMKLLNKKRRRIILHLRCDAKKTIENNEKSMKILHKISKMADVILTLNIESLNFCKRHYSNTSIEIISNFISTDIVKSSSKIISDKINTVIFVGLVHEEKGFFEIVEVAKSFPKIKFELVGNRSTQTYEIKSGSNVVFIDNASRKDVIKKLDNADIFFFPSHSEGFSNALLEAMARGLPIICTNVGANAEMVAGGIVVNVHDVDAMVDALEKMRSKEVREIMSEANLLKVKENFLVERVFDDLLKIYLR